LGQSRVIWFGFSFEGIKFDRKWAEKVSGVIWFGLAIIIDRFSFGFGLAIIVGRFSLVQVFQFNRSYV
jgi:hypothetical protein